MKPLLLLIFLAALGLGAMFLTLGKAPSGGEPDLQPSHSQGTQTEVAQEHELPDAPVAPSAEHVAALVSNAAPAPAESVEAPSAEQQLTDAELSSRRWAAQQLRLGQQYDHLNRDELKSVLAELQTKIGQERTKHFKVRFERGNYDIQFIDQPPLTPPVPDSRGRMPQQEVQVVTDPQTMGTQSNIATLPFELYPAYYELLDEEAWLLEHIEG